MRDYKNPVRRNLSTYRVTRLVNGVTQSYREYSRLTVYYIKIIVG